jgi:hypothetical protein
VASQAPAHVVAMIAWMQDHTEVLTWTTIASVVLLVGSLVGGAAVLVRLPPDYFVNPERLKAKSMAWRVIRNVLGWLFIAAGAAMLVLPGQGVLVLLIGVMLADFPGKQRVERWILARPKVGRTINWVRAKFGRELMQLPRGRARINADVAM